MGPNDGPYNFIDTIYYCSSMLECQAHAKILTELWTSRIGEQLQKILIFAESRTLLLRISKICNDKFA